MCIYIFKTCCCADLCAMTLGTNGETFALGTPQNCGQWRPEQPGAICPTVQGLPQPGGASHELTWLSPSLTDIGCNRRHFCLFSLFIYFPHPPCHVSCSPHPRRFPVLFSEQYINVAGTLGRNKRTPKAVISHSGSSPGSTGWTS